MDLTWEERANAIQYPVLNLPSYFFLSHDCDFSLSTLIYSAKIRIELWWDSFSVHLKSDRELSVKSITGNNTENWWIKELKCQWKELKVKTSIGGIWSLAKFSMKGLKDVMCYDNFVKKCTSNNSCSVVAMFASVHYYQPHQPSSDVTTSAQ